MRPSPLILAWLLLFFAAPLCAEGGAAATPLAETLDDRIASIDAGAITPADLERARIHAESMRVRLESARLDRRAAEAAASALEEEIAALERRAKELRVDAALSAEERARREAELRGTSERRQAELAQRREGLTGLRGEERRLEGESEVARRWYEALREAYQRHQELSRLEALADVEARLLAEERKSLTRAEALRERMAALAEGEGTEREALLEEIAVAEERARLKRAELALSRAEAELNTVTEVEEREETLRSALSRIGRIVAELEAGAGLLREKSAVVHQRMELMAKRRLLDDPRSSKPGRVEKLLAGLIEAMERQQAVYDRLLGRAAERSGALEARLQRYARLGLFARHHLPEDGEQWHEVGEMIDRAPEEAARYLATLIDGVVEGGRHIDAGRWVLLLLLETVLLFGWWWLRKLLWLMGGGATGSALVVALARRLLPFAALSTALLLFGWGVQLPFEPLLFLFYVAAIWGGVIAALDLAAVFAPSEAEGGGERGLRPIRWMVPFGAAVGTLALLYHWSGPPAAALDLLDRVVMALLFVALPAVVRLWLMLDAGLVRRYSGRLWLPAARLLILLPPLALFVGAAFGVAGYLNLARSLFGGVGWAILVFTLWMLAVDGTRGVANLLKNFALRHAGYGLLWAQGVIEPLRKLINLVLLAAAAALLFRVYGWNETSPVVRFLREMLNAPLFTIGETTLEVEALLKGLLFLALVIWGARWVREITYRWLYVSVEDLGIRLSLSTFTQYAALLVGLLVALHLLDIDITALAVFAGALGVGLGLGLQNVANNFISGLLLIAEQPLKTGDMVTIGGQEGQVTRFGIRSLTIKTWENQEVIIPNSEVISAAFTNWTLSDNVMRTWFIVGVSYDADPHRVKQLLEETVAAHPAVLAEPPFKVWLWEYGDSSVNFRVQYYTDLVATSRLEVISEMHLAIWDALKANGIVIPYPQRDLYIKQWPSPPIVGD